MSAVNPLIEPGDSAPPEIPRDVPESTPAPEEKATPAKIESVEKPEGQPEKPAQTDAEKYENVRRALQEERREKAALKAALDEAKKNSEEFSALKAKMDERRAQIDAENERKAFEENPAEFLREQVTKIGQKVDEVAQTSTQKVQEWEQQNAIFTAIQSQTAAFAKETPDYNDAFQFMHDRRMAEYDVLGVPPEMREAQFNMESLQFAQQAMQSGRNPAEMAYNMAKAWGFTAKPAAVPAKADADATITRLEQGQKAAATLSTGGKGEESLLKRVDEMSDAEFEKFWKEEMVPKHH